jgi:hypothetical protein
MSSLFSVNIFAVILLISCLMVVTSNAQPYNLNLATPPSKVPAKLSSTTKFSSLMSGPLTVLLSIKPCVPPP